MAIIYVDMDGITDDFIRAFVEVYNEHAKEPISPMDIKTWELADSMPDKEAAQQAFNALARPGWWLALPLLADNIPGILKKWNTKHLVYILSSPWNALSAKEKYERVDEHFPFLGRKRVILAKDKHLMQGDLIIDDKPKTLAAYKKHNPSAKVATVTYPYHDEAIENGDLPPHTFFADDYAHPEQAWEQLDKYVQTVLG